MATNHTNSSKGSKKRRKHGKKKKHDPDDPFATPMDPSRCITFHLVHRSNEDPLVNNNGNLGNDDKPGEWVLEPNIDNEEQLNVIQSIFSQNDMEDALPFYLRSEEYTQSICDSHSHSHSNKNNSKASKKRYNQGVDFYDAMLNESGRNEDIDKSTYNSVGEDCDYSKYYKEISGDGVFIEAEYNDTKKQKKVRAINRMFNTVSNMDDMNTHESENKSNEMDDLDKIDEIAFESEKIPLYLEKIFDNSEGNEETRQAVNRYNPEYTDYFNILFESDENDVKRDDNSQVGDDYDDYSNQLADDFVFSAMGVTQKEFEEKQKDEKMRQISTFIKPDIAKFNKAKNDYNHKNDTYGNNKYETFLNTFLDDIPEISENENENDSGNENDRCGIN